MRRLRVFGLFVIITVAIVIQTEAVLAGQILYALLRHDMYTSKPHPFRMHLEHLKVTYNSIVVFFRHKNWMGFVNLVVSPVLLVESRERMTGIFRIEI